MILQLASLETSDMLLQQLKDVETSMETQYRVLTELYKIRPTTNEEVDPQITVAQALVDLYKERSQFGGALLGVAKRMEKQEAEKDCE